MARITGSKARSAGTKAGYWRDEPAPDVTGGGARQRSRVPRTSPEDLDLSRARYRWQAPPVVVVVPTYNEAANLPVLYRRLREVAPDVSVLVVDDASPDGTGDLAEALARRDSLVHVLHRGSKAGLGRAYLAGMSLAMEAGARVVLEMDADGSHQPEEMPRLLSAIEEGADLVIGSRYRPGGTCTGWARHRYLLSRLGNLYARALLRVPVSDLTSGYRAFTRHALEVLPLTTVESQGYCFQIEMVLLAHEAGLRVVEVPITFVERSAGESKLSGGVALEALKKVTSWAAHGHRATR